MNVMMMSKPRNLLLDLMPLEIREEVTDTGVPFAVPCGHRIASDELQGKHVFIIAAGVASQFLVGKDGRLSEIGMIGPEGLFPVSGLLDVPSTPKMVVAQVGTLRGWRIRAKDFHRILSISSEAQMLVRKAAYTFVTQLASNILSVEQNSVSARLARWLLMCHDRIEGDDLHVTHDVLGQMAGAHRPTVTNVLHDMRGNGSIELSRACIKICRRDQLRILAAGSYGQCEEYWQQNIGNFGKCNMLSRLMNFPPSTAASGLTAVG